MGAPRSTVTERVPVDVTQELPLDDENVLAPEPASRWRRYRWPIVGVVVVVVAASVVLPVWLTAGSSSPGGLSVTTVTVPVTTGTIQQTVVSSGTIEPATQASLNFAVSGTVSAVDVKAGQQVSAGQVLATVGTTALSEQVSAAQAALTAAEDRLSSDQGANALQSTLDSDQASVTSAQASLANAQTNLGEASLTSAISGTVATVDLSVGEVVTGTGTGSGGAGSGGSGSTGTGSSATGSASASSSGGSGNGSSGQIVVIGTDSYLVNTTVDDTQIGQIAEGDQAEISLGGGSGSGSGLGSAGSGTVSAANSSASTIYGTVGSISLVGSQSSNVTTFPVVIDVTGSPSGLYAGASAGVSIIVRQLNDVTEVPTAAISYSSSGQATVTEVVDGAHVVRNVTVGAAQNGETQIVSGIGPGAKVLEREVTFKAPGGGRGGLFGGTGTRGGFGGAGGFPGGGFGGAGGFGGLSGGGLRGGG